MIAKYLISIGVGMCMGTLNGLCFVAQHAAVFRKEQGAGSALSRSFLFYILRFLFLLCTFILLRWLEISPILTLVAIVVSFWHMLVRQGVVGRGRS